jgi:hypothetical protein
VGVGAQSYLVMNGGFAVYTNELGGVTSTGEAQASQGAVTPVTPVLGSLCAAVA